MLHRLSKGAGKRYIFSLRLIAGPLLLFSMLKVELTTILVRIIEEERLSFSIVVTYQIILW
jgi:hypothetical protein